MTTKRTIGWMAALTLAALCLVASAAIEPVARVDWSGRDIGGAAVRVPGSATRPSVVVFVMPGQARSAQALEQAAAVMRDKDADGAAVAVVVSGPQADAEARKISATTPWPVVADADYTVSAAMGIHVWPTTVIVRGDGVVAAHLAGLSKSFPTAVAAHAALALGRIDEATFERRMGVGGTVHDDPEQMAERHLRVAQRLLDKGLLDQARTELQSSLKLHPHAPRLQVAVARVHLALGEVAEASQVIDRIEAGAVHPTQISLLRGKVLAAQGKWPEAATLLEQATRLNPEPAEAWYELGVALEKQGESAKAAGAFRKAFEATTDGRKLLPAAGR